MLIESLINRSIVFISDILSLVKYSYLNSNVVFIDVVIIIDAVIIVIVIVVYLTVDVIVVAGEPGL